MKKAIVLWFLFFACCGAIVRAQGTDPELVQWKTAFSSGDYEQLLASVEKNLASETPHPYGINAWVAAHEAQGDLSAALQRGNQPWKQQLRDFVAIRTLAEQEQDGKLYTKYINPQMNALEEQSWADVIINTSELSSEATRQYLLEYVQKPGLTFRTIWALSNLMENNERVRIWLGEQYEAGNIDDSTLLGRFVYRQAVMNQQDEPDLIALVKNEEELLATDAMANRFLAHQLKEMEHYKEAEKYYQKSFELNPFYGRNLTSIAETQGRFSHFEAAEKTVRKAAQLYAPTGRDRFFYRHWSSVLYTVGHYAQTQAALEKGLKQFPDDAELNYRMGRLQISNGRPEFAINYLKKAANAKPDNLTTQRYYLQALSEANQIEAFLSAYERVAGRYNMLTPAIYVEIADTYTKYEEPAIALQTLEKGLRHFSESGWLYREYAAALENEGDLEGAIQAMQTSFEVDEIYEWPVWRLTQLMKASGKTDAEIDTKLRELAISHSWSSGVWKEWADQADGMDAQAAIWQLAMEHEPQALFPYESIMRDILWPRRQWTQALDDLEQFSLRFDEHYVSAADRAKVHFERGIVYIGKVRTEGLTTSEYEQALHHFKKYLDDGGYPGAYYQYIYELHKAQKNAKKAAKALRNWILYRPNTYRNRSQTISQIPSEFPDRFLIYNELLQRRPYDWQNWKAMIQYNSVYGGSAINAIRLGREFRQRFPNRKGEIERFIGISYGKLGSNIKHFEDAYGDRSSLGKSQRYINWFNSAKHNAWEGSTNLSFDWETNTATLLFENGTVAKITDDPLTARTTKVQVGNAFMEAKYNDDIQMTDIIRSDGESINLRYDDAGNIIEMRSPESEDITLAYDSLGHPHQMIIKSQPPDTIRVYYSTSGSVDSVQSSKGGQAALKLTQAFQKLIAYSRVFGDAASEIAAARLPHLGITDERYQKLQTNVGYNAGLVDKIAFIKYLVAHTNINPSYGSEALALIEESFYEHEKSREAEIQSQLVELIGLNYELMMKIRSMGLPQSAWLTWADMTDWLTIQEAAGGDQQVTTLLAEIEAHPLELLPSSQWLPKSDLYNASYWKTFSIKDLIKESLQNDIEVNTSFIRQNGDVLLGTNKGLLLYHKGYWQHLGYNFIRRSFENNPEAVRINATSDILAITEDDSGTLYLGAADGLFVLDGYKGPVRKRLSITDGLPSKSVTHLDFYQGKVLAGTPVGGVWLAGDTIEAPVFEGEEIRFTDQSPSGSHLLIGTDKAIYLSDDGGTTDAIYNEPRQDGIFSADGSKIYTLKGTQVWVEELVGARLLNEHTLNGELVTTDAKQVYGLSLLPVSIYDHAPAVQTDLGLSVYHERHFEHFYLDRETGARPRQLVQSGQRFVAVTDDDVRIFRRNTNDISSVAPKDLLSFNSLGFTVIADGGNPKLISHNDSENVIRDLFPDDYMATSVLAKAGPNELLLNDAQQILRLTFNADSAGFVTEELFYAAADMPADDNLTHDSSIKNIVMDGDYIWIATGNAVFRYQELVQGVGDVKEFNYFSDAERFPCYSDMVYNIFKTISGDIYAVCSYENHRKYNGVALKGGLLKYDRNTEDGIGRFVRVNTDDATYNWFVHSYTAINEEKAVLGTSSGFGIDESGSWQGLKYWKANASYEQVYEQHPSLFLGTKGAAIGDLWLFGSASGVLAYYNDNWFYPSRINAQLPQDSEYGHYGGRHVNAIATSGNGKVYVGTDLGLLVYDSQSADPTKFIMDNYSVERSIEFFNTQIVQREQDRILDLKDIPEDSEVAELIVSLKETKQQVARVKAQKARLDKPVELLATGMQGSHNSVATTDSLAARLKSLNRKQNDLLLTLQQHEPSLYQAVQIDPLDLRSSRSGMNANDVVVQFLPMSRKLFIQVLAKNDFQLREVEITKKALMDSVSLVAADLAQKSEGLRVGVVGGDVDVPVELSEARLDNLLSYLYEQLLRPIENDIAGYENVYIAPVGKLNYLPFSALVDRQNERDITYAVEKYNMGYVSSMYLFNLMYNTQSPPTQTALLMGDPDGSLTGAREEVQQIEQLIPGGQVFVGDNATSKNFTQNLSNTNIIHLATHGYLNDESLKDSWILFSDKKLKLSEVYNLDLSSSSLVVLSACQTSLGGDGIEYATLSRAFLNAGTPSIIGTLWKVDDMPSKELMVNFYRFLDEGNNKFKALALAKRELIKSNEARLNHPSKWASYIMIGKP